MFARKLKPEERYRSGLNMAVAFEGGFDLQKERAAAQEAKEDPRSDHWGAFQEGCGSGPSESYPVASLVMNLFDARFDGHVVKMGGVGGVATLPAHRRGGAIRACMDASLRDLYDRGFAFASLYPFSSAYYRKFGFEDGAPVYNWTLPISDLDPSDVGGSMEQLFPGDSLLPLLEVYRGFYGDVNLSVVRQAYDEDLEKENFLEEKRSIFVWRDENGAPGAFLIGKRNGEVLDCSPTFEVRGGFLFRDVRALQALLYFVKTAFAANFQALRFSVPVCVNVLSLVKEAASMECRMFLNGMARIVNVEQVLRLCRCRGEGTVTLEVEDPMLPENQGIFRLTFAPGMENRVERTGDRADVSLKIGDLTSLLCGMRSGEELAWMPEVQVHNGAAPLEQVFYQKPCQIIDLF